MCCLRKKILFYLLVATFSSYEENYSNLAFAQETEKKSNTQQQFKHIISTEQITFFFSKNSKKIADPEMVLVRGGCFEMGDTFSEGWDSELPVTSVCLGDYYLGTHEVTQREWQLVMGSNPATFKKCGLECPVEKVSWNDIQLYVKLLNKKTGKKYRLPTEAEWEFAARNRGENIRFSTGSNKIGSDHANFDARPFGEELYSIPGTYKGKTTQVKSYPPNALGLYDMSGNVWELLSDKFTKHYYGASTLGNTAKNWRGSFLIIRGGGWKDHPKSVRATRRIKVLPNFKGKDLGFRLARLP